MLKPQKPPRTDGDEYGYDNGYKESEGGCFHTIDEIHTESEDMSVGNMRMILTEVSVRITVFMLLLMMPR